jgi:hypothetical protein
MQEFRFVKSRNLCMMAFGVKSIGTSETHSHNKPQFQSIRLISRESVLAGQGGGFKGSVACLMQEEGLERVVH